MRRNFLKGVLAAIGAVTLGLANAPVMAQAKTLKISHQFPGSSGKDGDFRDILCRRFGEELAAKSGGEVNAQIYAGSSLMKVNSQISSLRKGALDMSLVPISYAGGRALKTPFGTFFGPNITPHATAGIGRWGEIGRAHV